MLTIKEDRYIVHLGQADINELYDAMRNSSETNELKAQLAEAYGQSTNNTLVLCLTEDDAVWLESFMPRNEQVVEEMVPA